jgi:hypothetical protein
MNWEMLKFEAHDREYDYFCLLDCNTMQVGRRVPMFQRNLLPPSSGQKWR